MTQLGVAQADWQSAFALNSELRCDDAEDEHDQDKHADKPIQPFHSFP